MINVPLLLRWPVGVTAGTVVGETVQNIDVMPTLLELSGLRVPESLQGKSLVPFLRDEGAEWGSRPRSPSGSADGISRIATAWTRSPSGGLESWRSLSVRR